MRADPVGNLPQELTSFVGRHAEQAQVSSLLTGSRLVTLLGVGGVGKTRLALQVTAQVRPEFGAGVWLVELDQVQDEDLIAHAVARALGLREEPGLSPVAMLREYLAGRRLLLMLDNCEHLVDGVAKLVDTLLRYAPEVRILATSREPLRLEGERTHLVAPLAVPDPKQAMGMAELAGYEAVALFTDRAQAVGTGFELTEANRAAVGEICARLDGLPLAIELAVAQLRVLTPEQIRDRLVDRALLTWGRRSPPTRQHTLRACIEWSHDLCTGAEQLLWARLSVFAGDFDLDAVEGVCADEHLPDGDVLDLIAGLLDKSILLAQPEQADAVRYRMLESIRTYGRERLAGSGEEALLRRRHRDWHQQLVARFHAEWIGPRQLDWLRRLDRTLPDISAAMEFSLSVPEHLEAALAMAGELYMYWGVSGLHHQARYWLNRALTPAGTSSPARLAALVFEATFAGASGDVAAETVRVQQAREVAGCLGDPHSHALATAAEGRLTTGHGDLPAAIRLYSDALGVFRAENDVQWQAISLTNLIFAKVLLDDTAGAATAHEEMLALCRARGECVLSGFTAMALGIGLWKQGDFAAAATQTTQTLQLLHRAGGTLATYWCLEVTAWIAASRDQPERAATLLGCATALAHTMGTRATHWPDLLTYHEQCQQQVRHALGEPAFEASFEDGHRLSLNDAISYALGRPEDPPRPAPPAPSTPAWSPPLP